MAVFLDGDLAFEVTVPRGSKRGAVQTAVNAHLKNYNATARALRSPICGLYMVEPGHDGYAWVATIVAI